METEDLVLMSDCKSFHNCYVLFDIKTQVNSLLCIAIQIVCVVEISVRYVFNRVNWYDFNHSLVNTIQVYTSKYATYDYHMFLDSYENHM